MPMLVLKEHFPEKCLSTGFHLTGIKKKKRLNNSWLSASLSCGKVSTGGLSGIAEDEVLNVSTSRDFQQILVSPSTPLPLRIANNEDAEDRTNTLIQTNTCYGMRQKFRR